MAENNRGLKTRKAFSNAIDIVLFNKLEELKNTTRIPMSKLLDEAIEDLIKKYERK